MEKFEITNDQNYNLRQLEWNSKLAVATSLERVRKMQLKSELKLYCFNNPNNIYEYSLKILMKKDFALVNELNRFIRYASDGGLIVKWLKGNTFISDSEKSSKFGFSEAHLNSLLFNGIIFCGVSTLSMIVFIAEMLVYKNVQKNVSSTFWRYCQMFIDPYRYFLLKDLWF